MLRKKQKAVKEKVMLKHKKNLIFAPLLCVLGLLASFFYQGNGADRSGGNIPISTTKQATTQPSEQASERPAFYSEETYYIPEYNGKISVTVNNNEPNFAELQKPLKAYYVFRDLDELGRVGQANALLGKETLPVAKRTSIKQVIPSGWHQNLYSFIEQQALYARCHLIAHQLCGENANAENLMTGTHMFNNEGMLPYENIVKDYIKRTGNHVQYRVTPYYGYFDFNSENLLADGVQMEAESVEDNGKGVKYNVFVYNVQPGVAINYHTGENTIDALGKTMGKMLPMSRNTKEKKYKVPKKLAKRGNKSK